MPSLQKLLICSKNLRNRESTMCMGKTTVWVLLKLLPMVMKAAAQLTPTPVHGRNSIFKYKQHTIRNKGNQKSITTQ